MTVFVTSFPDRLQEGLIVFRNTVFKIPAEMTKCQVGVLGF